MRVVLREDIVNIGKRGDIIEVSDGYARNHLVPSGKAIIATDGISAQASSMRRARDLKDAKDREAAEAIAQRLVPLVITVPARAGREGRLFGSVTPGEILAAVESQSGVALDRHRLVSHEPIKTLGTHELAVRLHADVEFPLHVEVVSG